MLIAVPSLVRGLTNSVSMYPHYNHELKSLSELPLLVANVQKSAAWSAQFSSWSIHVIRRFLPVITRVGWRWEGKRHPSPSHLLFVASYPATRSRIAPSHVKVKILIVNTNQNLPVSLCCAKRLVMVALNLNRTHSPRCTNPSRTIIEKQFLTSSFSKSTLTSAKVGLR